MQHTQGLFRSVGMPAHQDRHAHERFLLDTYAERRVEEKPSRAPRWMRAIVASITQ